MYRRDAVTWAAFAALFAFGFLNAVLGPSMPYLRAAEGISYVAGSLHQVAFAIGGGAAGLLAAREAGTLGRKATICGGLACAALAGLVLGYGDAAPLTIAAALLISFFGTSALVRVWALLADRHGDRRTVAMTEGEVAVSLAGIVTPLLIGGLAAIALGWRFAFVIGGATVFAAAAAVALVPVSAPTPARGAHEPILRRIEPTLVIVFAIVALEFTLSFWLASYLDDSVGLSRRSAVAMVSGLYAANLIGRLLASRLARRVGPAALLAGALAVALVGLPVLLAARGAAAAGIGIAIAGIGIGATFPLTSSLHVGASRRTADGALGEILVIAAIGQLAGPLVAGGIAQLAGLRAALLIVPALVVVAGAALARARTW